MPLIFADVVDCSKDQDLVVVVDCDAEAFGKFFPENPVMSRNSAGPYV